MKQLYFIFFLLFLFSINSIKAQQNHYIYIQTENKQPFYLKMENKQYSSSISGYLIVAKLKDGNYKLTIGFPKNEWPEQNLECTVANNDAGYLLKNFDSKGWGLFNLQSLAVIMAKGKDKPENIEVVNKTDAFSNMLSSVVNDSTIRQTETVKEEIKKAPSKEETMPGKPVEKEMVQAVVIEEALKTNSNGVTRETAKKPDTVSAGAVEKQNDIGDPTNSKKSVITRSLLHTSKNGTEMVFIEDTNGEKDTIRIFIPADKDVAIVNEKTAAAVKNTAAQQEVKPKDTKFLEIEMPNPNQQQAQIKPVESKSPDEKVIDKKIGEIKLSENKPIDDSVSEVKATGNDSTKDAAAKLAEPVAKTLVMINSDCKSFATDEDFLKLRKKMAAADTDDDMIAIAKKVFKVKCFTVEQIKNLSVLFLKDAGKYAFFDMVYPFTADSHNFHILQGQLTDAYFISRFQAMVRH